MPEGHRWTGYSHEELYEKIHSGPGPGASHASVARWVGVSNALTEINAELQAGVLRSGAQWEGGAADRARAGINPLASWADSASAGADVMRVSTEMQADYIAKARADMPPPVKVTAEDPGGLLTGLTHLVGGQTDYEQQEKAHDAAEQRAREVMTTYASSTTSNTSTLGQFHQPPQLVINAGDVVRNDAPGVAGGHGFHGGRGGHGGWWNNRGRGGRPVVTRPVSSSRPTAPGGSTTRVSQVGSQPGSGSAPHAPDSTSTNRAPASTGVVPGGAANGQNQQDRKNGGKGGRNGGAGGANGTTTPEQNTSAAATAGHGAGGGGSAALGHSSGTTSVSSAEFGAIATANQQASSLSPGGASGALAGAGQAGGGDTVHKRTVQALPQQPAFDPFGGLGTGRSAEEEEDRLHDAADYLRETDDVYGVGGMISPAVIGEDRDS